MRLFCRANIPVKAVSGQGVDPVHMLSQLTLGYLLVGAATFPVYMGLDKHTYTHVIETTGELVVLVVCWIVFWPAIGFFVVRNQMSSHRRGDGIRQKVQLR